MQKPRIKQHYHLEMLPQEKTVFLMSEVSDTILSGDLYMNLIPLLNGENTLENLIEKMDGKANFMQIQYALSGLRKSGVIEDFRPEIPAEVAAFWNILEIDSYKAIEKLAETTIAIDNHSQVDDAGLREAFTTLGLTLGEGADADITVVLVDDYMQSVLADINQRAMDSGRQWILAKPVGAKIWLGPHFSLPDTACWDCLRQRITINREIQTLLLNINDHAEPLPVSRSALPTTLNIAFNLLATEIAKLVAIEDYNKLKDQVITLDTITLEKREHHLVKRPQCKVCGEPIDPNREAQPLVIESQPKRFTADGGHRIMSPQEMLEQFEHHVSDITGAVNYLDVRYQIPGLVYVYHAYNNFNVRYLRWQDLRLSRFQRSGGKGMSREQAKASGLGEAIERYCASLFGHEIIKKASYTELGDDAVHPATVLQYSQKQYMEWEKWLQMGGRQVVPMPFDEEQVVDWTPIWSLTENKFKYLPTAFLYFGYWDSEEIRNAFTWSDSNGNASGSTIEEAILQGFMEVIERDAIALWWYNRVQRPKVDLDSFGVPYFSRLKEFYASEGRDIWMIDITTDLGIPCFAGVSYRNTGESQEVCVGYGAHFDPRIAAARALTEVNELYSAVLTTRTEDGDFHIDPEIRNWLVNTTIEEHQYLVPHPDLPVKYYDDFDYTPTTDLKDDIEHAVNLMREKGFEILVLDQSQPDVGLKVAKVIVPHLRHFWARFAPGRLYDVPVELGWLDEPTAEEDLNPVPMFF